MKKILCILFALSFALFGCGKKATVDENNSSDASKIFHRKKHKLRKQRLNQTRILPQRVKRRQTAVSG